MTDVGTLTLSDFLLARISEDEDAAREANGQVAWLAFRDEHGGMLYTTVAHRMTDETPWVVDGAAIETDDGAPFYDSARVLAECEAKRRIVGHHARRPDPAGDSLGDLCAICSEVGPDAQGWPCETVCLLALPYADHPDYRSAWAV